MHDKKYDHPVRKGHEHNYRKDMYRIEDHIKDIVHDNYHQGRIQHLGGAASLLDHLQELHYGYACMVKKELERVLSYLHMYATTCHCIYYFFAEDALRHVEQLQSDARDISERDYAQTYIEYVDEYMHWLKAHVESKDGTHDQSVVPGLRL